MTIRVKETTPYDLTDQLPVVGSEIDFSYFTAAVNLGSATFRLLHDAGHPTNLDLTFERDARDVSPFHCDFWVPPGVPPKFSATAQEGGLVGVSVALPNLKNPSMPSINTATYTLRMPELGYSGVQIRLSSLGRVFFVLEGDDYSPGYRKRPKSTVQLKPTVVMNAMSESLHALAIGSPHPNGTYRFETVH